MDTVGGTEYAADYPFYLEQSLREKYGRQFVLLFGTGTCGDINHIDVTKKERLKTEHIGRTLAQTVSATVDELPAVQPTLAVRSEVVQVPLQHYGQEKIAWAKENINKVGTRELPFLKQVEAYKILALQMRGSQTIGLEVQVFRLSNDVAVVGLPGEVFVDLGLAIKQASPFATTLLLELCQDAPGYIPTKKAFAEGSYETVNSRIAPGGGEMMVEAAVRLLKTLGRPAPKTELVGAVREPPVLAFLVRGYALSASSLIFTGLPDSAERSAAKHTAIVSAASSMSGNGRIFSIMQSRKWETSH